MTVSCPHASTNVEALEAFMTDTVHCAGGGSRSASTATSWFSASAARWARRWRAWRSARRPAKRVIGVARFSEPGLREKLEAQGIECIACDLLERAALERLPRVANVVFMAGHKFGAAGNAGLTWAMNVAVPFMVAETFRDSRIVAFSTACVYPYVDVDGPGASEIDAGDAAARGLRQLLRRPRAHVRVRFAAPRHAGAQPAPVLRHRHALRRAARRRLERVRRAADRSVRWATST